MYHPSFRERFFLRWSKCFTWSSESRRLSGVELLEISQVKQKFSSCEDDLHRMRYMKPYTASIERVDIFMCAMLKLFHSSLARFSIRRVIQWGKNISIEFSSQVYSEDITRLNSIVNIFMDIWDFDWYSQPRDTWLSFTVDKIYHIEYWIPNFVGSSN